MHNFKMHPLSEVHMCTIYLLPKGRNLKLKESLSQKFCIPKLTFSKMGNLSGTTQSSTVDELHHHKLKIKAKLSIHFQQDDRSLFSK